MDELVTARESICLGPFQTEIIEGWVKPLLGDMAHVMITPLKVGEGQPWKARPLPPGTPCSPHVHTSQEWQEWQKWQSFIRGQEHAR